MQIFFKHIYLLLFKICHPGQLVMRKYFLSVVASLLLIQGLFAQKNKDISVLGYFAGRTTALDSFPVGKLTHLIYSFCHLKGNRLSVDNAYDSLQVKKMVSMKEKYPHLKVILSLGGWGGCKDCSPVFATKEGRKEFAQSAKELMEYFQTDGIDLDWEYPAISGFPGHVFTQGDKKNFTSLLKVLRRELGKKYEISFAAGGFDQYIDSSIEWKKAGRLVDKINIISYDLVNGFSTVSGHHTPLYSTPEQKQSTDNAVKRLIAEGVPSEKLIIGAAFYSRFFLLSETNNNGLYDPARFDHGVSYSRLYDSITEANGFVKYWDIVAEAPYAFNVERKILATYDDSISISVKTRYAMEHKLGGIMFWQLMDDKFSGGLLDVIDKVRKAKNVE